jgi:phospholipase C
MILPWATVSFRPVRIKANVDTNSKSTANLAYLASEGILLDNYFAITHPSQPNYVVAGGANTHGITDDSFKRIDNGTETIVDLLEAAGVSWSIYQEDMPYSGFQGTYVNQRNGANDYVRKHK